MEVRPHNSMFFDSPTDIIVLDPCYIFDYRNPALCKAWDDFCDLSMPASEDRPCERKGTIIYNEAKLLYSATMHGDGDYVISFARHGVIKSYLFGVDSGLMGVMKLADIHKINPAFDATKHCIVENFRGQIIATGTSFSGDLGTREHHEEGAIS